MAHHEFDDELNHELRIIRNGLDHDQAVWGYGGLSKPDQRNRPSREREHPLVEELPRRAVTATMPILTPVLMTA